MRSSFTIYSFMSAISLFIRQTMLPNPFEKLPVLSSLDYFGISIPIEFSAFILMAFAELFIHAFTYAVVGIYYAKRIDHPAKGSFLYLFFYCIHIATLSIMAQFQFASQAVILIIAAYIACHFGIAKLLNKLHSFSRYGF